MSRPFCSPDCGIYPDDVKGACNECINSDNEMYPVAIAAIWLGEEVMIDGEGKEGYHLQDGGWVEKSGVTIK